MYGFVNGLLAAAFAWHGTERPALVDRLDRRAGHDLLTGAVQSAREFAPGFGSCFRSCSFEPPVADLRELGWLP